LVTPLVEKGIIEEPLFYEEMLLYINKNHPLAKTEDIKPNELASPDLWLLKNGHCFRSQVINLCNYKTNSLESSHFEYTSDSLETIKKMVEIESGFTLLPELAIPNYKTNAIIKQFASVKPLREISFVYTRNYMKKKILNLLSQEIKSAIPQEMLDKERGNIAEWRETNVG
jgi:LysR family hydrogen peroxide-inducible transcriptional activator